jgi:hypothetical protein
LCLHHLTGRALPKFGPDVSLLAGELISSDGPYLHIRIQYEGKDKLLDLMIPHPLVLLVAHGTKGQKAVGFAESLTKPRPSA